MWREVTWEPRGAAISHPDKFTARLKPRMLAMLEERFALAGPQKVFMFEEVMFKMPGDAAPHLQGLSTGSKRGSTGIPVLKKADAEAVIDRLFEALHTKITEYEGRGSGLVLQRIVRVTLKLCKFKPFHGKGYGLGSPQWLTFKQAVINIKNRDNRCFLYAVALGRHLVDVKTHRDLPNQYE
jgi:hypothetical protein